MTDRHIGFTGTRNGMTTEQARAVESLLHGYDRLHHGDCVGSDAQVHDIAFNRGLTIEIHPPKLSSLRAWCRADIYRDPREYISRNHAIVDSTEGLIAVPAGMEEERHSGTWATIRYARKIGKPVWIVFPDGSVEHHLPRKMETAR
jgi:hypothetical protein